MNNHEPNAGQLWETEDGQVILLVRDFATDRHNELSFVSYGKSTNALRVTPLQLQFLDISTCRYLGMATQSLDALKQ